jgi:hypothetical protein|tara:strand:+ start:267 stop:545 length:279 start_codon:yes stop_codon:yes gene_type:complete
MNAIKFDPDLNQDGVLTGEEITIATQVEKATLQSRLTLASFICLILLGAILVSGFLAVDLIKAISPIISSLIFGFTGIIGFYFGAQAWSTRK